MSIQSSLFYWAESKTSHTRIKKLINIWQRLILKFTINRLKITIKIIIGKHIIRFDAHSYEIVVIQKQTITCGNANRFIAVIMCISY